jgi:quercetin dioxygenase-like cupin family protein
MDKRYTFFSDLAQTVDAIPTDSIVSRTLYQDDQFKAILFAFAPGQELSQHTASVAAMFQILEGEATLTFGDDAYEVKAGAWARMEPRLPHSLLAHTPVRMLLIMLSA